MRNGRSLERRLTYSITNLYQSQSRAKCAQEVSSFNHDKICSDLGNHPFSRLRGFSSSRFYSKCPDQYHPQLHFLLPHGLSTKAMLRVFTNTCKESSLDLEKGLKIWIGPQGSTITAYPHYIDGRFLKRLDGW